LFKRKDKKKQGRWWLSRCYLSEEQLLQAWNRVASEILVDDRITSRRQNEELADHFAVWNSKNAEMERKEQSTGKIM